LAPVRHFLFGPFTALRRGYFGLCWLLHAMRWPYGFTCPCGQTCRPQRVRRVTFLPHTRRIYVRRSGWHRASGAIVPSPTVRPPRMRFVYLGPGVCLQLPPDASSRLRPCCSA